MMHGISRCTVYRGTVYRGFTVTEKINNNITPKNSHIDNDAKVLTETIKNRKKKVNINAKRKKRTEWESEHIRIRNNNRRCTNTGEKRIQKTN